MTNTFKSKVLKSHAHSNARSLKVTTPHGDFLTPCFMPVATRAYVNCMSSENLLEAGSQIILGGNTYHMLLNPGMEFIHHSGGMHSLMGWNTVFS